jgi:polysaccharide biosynthesis/export protein
MKSLNLMLKPFYCFNYPILLLGTILLSFTACTSPKKMKYLQGNNNTTHQITRDYTYQIQTGDVLFVKINTLDNHTYESFNAQGEAGSRSTSEIALYLNSYTVNDSGYINLPIVGDIKVSGLSIDETSKEIQKNVNVYLKETSIIVKLMSFKITILGEVQNPGVYQVYDASLTLFQALGLAGDLNNYGKRKNIKLIRQTPEGQKIIDLDITNQNILSSEYFYLLPNDVLYVEPHITKSFGFDRFPFTEMFTGITTLVIILTFINAK